jgi:tetratricopeptide (TPR) repeat protein
MNIQDKPWYLVAYGSLLLNENKRDSAVIYFEKALDETKRKNADILAAVADAHINSANGESAYAIELLQAAMKRDKKNGQLHVLMGNAYRKQHNGTEAYKAYQEALGKNGGHAEANYQLGNIFLTQKNASMYLEFFNKAIEADKEFAPAYYALYQHYLYTEPAKAMEFFNQYNSRADKDVRNKYSYTDLLYLTKKYNEAITLAKELISSEGNNVQARLYKLIAYSYQDLSDTATAIDYMAQYFQNEVDSNIIEKDYQTMAGLYISNKKPDSAIAYYQKALGSTTDSAQTYQYYKTLAKVSKSMADTKSEAHWLGKFYMGNDYVSNIDLFNWGLASYKAGDYVQADSVFGKYATKYPEQGHGYYWRARSNAAIDTAMTEGLAIQHYQKLIEVIKDEPSEAEKKWLVQAYGYLAAYETNTEKDYSEAISYFEELLKMDPENKDAKEYIGMLEKRLETSNESPVTNTNSTN